MSWVYEQQTGKLTRNDFVSYGYSGHGEGKNNPALQNVKNVGPIPKGNWTIQGPPFDTEGHGPYVMRLIPQDGTEVFGRSGFLMHGDNVHTPGTASEGCVIMPPLTRQTVWKSGDYNLEVV